MATLQIFMHTKMRRVIQGFQNQNNRGMASLVFSTTLSSLQGRPFTASKTRLPASYYTTFTGPAESITTLGKHTLKNNDYQTTPLMHAAKAGDLAMVRQLTQKDSNLINACDKGGRTALMYAAEKNNYHCFAHLIAMGANVNAADKDGKTALMLLASDHTISCSAPSFSRLECLRLLLTPRLNVDINATDATGKTALMYFASHPNDEWGYSQVAGSNSSISQLLKHDTIKIRTTDENGKTALDYAKEGGSKYTQNILIEHGALTGLALQLQPTDNVLCGSTALSSHPQNRIIVLTSLIEGEAGYEVYKSSIITVKELLHRRERAVKKS